MKKDKISNLTYLIYCVLFVIFTIPRTINQYFEFFNIFKIISVCCITLLFIIKNKNTKTKKISSFTKIFIFFVLFLFISTLINKISIITFFKVYSLNLGIVLLCELIFNSKYKDRFLKFFSNYFLLLLILNFVTMIICYMMGHPNGSLTLDKRNAIYLLGLDNRFIIYIIPTLIGFYYLFTCQESKREYKAKLIITYFLSFISLVMTWSASAMVVMLFLGFALMFIKKVKIDLNLKLILILFLIINILFVFFKIQYLFEFFIVGILHKSIDLSYRNIIWDDAINLLIKNPINIIYGFGYFDTSYSFVHMPIKVNHLHNLFMNNLFFSGVIGSIIYYFNFYKIHQNISSIKNKQQKNIICLFFCCLLGLMIFDTFELYQIYYFILYLIYKSNDFLILKEKSDVSNEK